MRKEALKLALDVCRAVPALLGERIRDLAGLYIAMDAGAYACHRRKERWIGYERL